tara:strand:- start:1211 stop:1393 length:183 start_codon:yes stop_codon:yes gene_type:complete
MVGDTGIEPVTSAMSRQRSPAELITLFLKVLLSLSSSFNLILDIEDVWQDNTDWMEKKNS